ncbi:MAG TPA: DUF1015 family protein [Pyrinomonadaceae bacterium]|nr:DUF1015 family protein [Pyrinomonadaceae bacterium]
MAVIQPFRALRPPVDRVAEVASPPYDVVSTEEARSLARDNPLSFLHVSRPEIDLPEGTDLYSDAVYRKAADNFEKLVTECPLTEEETPSVYIYRLIMNGHEQTGLVACCAVDEYDNNKIRKHERTRPDKEDDRTRHMLTLKSQTGPVFLTYRASADIDTMVLETTVSAPLYDFTSPDGVQHTVWHAPDPVRFVQAFREVPLLYIADGHHRAASASRARADLMERSFGHTGDENYNYFLTVIFPDNQLQILPYNRVVRDLNNLTAGEFFLKVKTKFDVTEDAPPTPESPGRFSMYFVKRWYGLTLKNAPAPSADPVSSLDVSLLQDHLLDPILGIKDVRTDKRIDFIGGVRGTKELEQLVDSSKAAVAFSLYPTTIEDLLRVSDADGIMPPKSTWFEPKLRDGILIHNI